MPGVTVTGGDGLGSSGAVVDGEMEGGGAVAAGGIQTSITSGTS